MQRLIFQYLWGIRAICSRIFVIGVVFSLLLPACSTVPVTGRKQIMLVSGSQMQSMSYNQYDQFLNENEVVTGTPQAAMIKRVGGRIQQAVEQYMVEKGLSSQLDGFKWEFNLVQDEQVNAWCMPGGKVVFYTGIMDICQDETGVAVVMGHEIAHAVAEHSAERMSQGLVAQGIALGVNIDTLEKSPEMRAVYNMAVGMSSSLGMLAYSRKHESEADRIGLIFSSMAGYNPEEAVDFWQRMEAQSDGKKPPQFLSTHPSHDTRIENLRAQMPQAKKIYQQNKGKY